MRKTLCQICFLAGTLMLCSMGVVASASPRDTIVIAQDTVKKKIADGASIDFGKKTEYDFGKIQERGGKKTGSMVFKNSGNKPLIITKVMVSCKCVSLDYSKKPVMPGAEGKITVTYDPKKQKGVFHKAIQVYSNDPQARHIVFVKGEVVE